MAHFPDFVLIDQQLGQAIVANDGDAIAKALAKIDPEARDAAEQSALHHAAALGLPALCAALGATHPELARSVDRFLMTPLMMAAQMGKTEALGPLARAGSEIDARSGQGCTAFMFAARQGKCGAMEALLALGADASIGSHHGANALHFACLHGDPASIEVALRHCDLSAVDANGLTALDMARACKSLPESALCALEAITLADDLDAEGVASRPKPSL